MTEINPHFVLHKTLTAKDGDPAMQEMIAVLYGRPTSQSLIDAILDEAAEAGYRYFYVGGYILGFGTRISECGQLHRYHQVAARFGWFGWTEDDHAPRIESIRIEYALHGVYDTRTKERVYGRIDRKRLCMHKVYTFDDENPNFEACHLPSKVKVEGEVFSIAREVPTFDGEAVFNVYLCGYDSTGISFVSRSWSSHPGTPDEDTEIEIYCFDDEIDLTEKERDRLLELAKDDILRHLPDYDDDR